MKLVVASNNPGKLREFGQLLAPLGWETIAQKELGVPECEEPHHTFVENALEKARHAARAVPGCQRWPTTPACVSTRSAVPPASIPRVMPKRRPEPKIRSAQQ